MLCVYFIFCFIFVLRPTWDDEDDQDVYDETPDAGKDPKILYFFFDV